MTIIDFLRKLTVHVALAWLFYFCLVVGLERLIPGFAAPFINLPEMGLALAAFLCLAVVFAPTALSKFGRFLSILLLASAFTVGGIFVWTRLAGSDSGLFLIAAYALVGVAALSAVFTRSHE